MAQIADTPLINDANLLAYYKAENTNDSKGSNNLTNHNSVAFNPGQFNNAFDMGSGNTNKYLDVASNLGVAGNDPLWVHMWVNVTSVGGVGQQTMVYHTSTTGADRDLIIIYQDGVTKKILVYDGTSSILYTTTLTFGTWYMIDVVRDYANGNLNRLYLNGSQVATGAIGSELKGTNIFSIGENEGGNPFSGLIDDVGVFNRIPLQSEITRLFNPFISSPVFGGSVSNTSYRLINKVIGY